MSPALLLALLGGMVVLPGLLALTCQDGVLETVGNSSQLEFEWNANSKACNDDGQDWGCQDTMLLIENGPRVNLVVTKGCTLAPTQSSRITQHRASPGLSIISYTRVCRENLCNDLSNTLPIWALPSSTEPGALRCPNCLSTTGCLSAAKLPCPAGSNRCYDGVLLMRGGNISTKLRVQGCLPQAGCNLLNGTQQVGPMNVKENCEPKSYLTCHQGFNSWMLGNRTQKPPEWNSSQTEMCNFGEVCQETLLLIDVGSQAALVGSKGCSNAQTRDFQNVTLYSGHLGILMASYTHFCSSHGCNSANSSSVLLNKLPRADVPVPGDLQCRTCVKFGGACSKWEIVTCPKGTTRCYSGDISFRSSTANTSAQIKGCMTQKARYLLHHIRNIGAFSVKETLEDETFEDKEEHSSSDKAGPAQYLAWWMGLGLPLTLWFRGRYPQC